MNGKIALLALFLAMGVVLAIQPATDWTLVGSDRYDPTPTAAVTAQAGNVTEGDLNSTQSTDKWAGFYGDVAGSTILADSTPTPFYTWTWTPADGGYVCATTGGFDWTGATDIVNSAIDTAWSFTIGNDLATDTFTDATCNIADLGVVGTTAVTTEGTGAFETCAIGDGAGAAKNNIAFCVGIQNGAANLFNGGTGNYQLLTATTQGSTDDYNFWVQLD